MGRARASFLLRTSPEFSFAVFCHLFSFIIRTVDLFRSDMLYIFNMDLATHSLKDSFVYPHSSYLDSGMIFQMLRSLFIVTHYKFGPIRSNYQVHLVSNWLHVGWVFYYLLLHRAGEIQLARNSSPRLHFSLSVWSLSCGCRVKFSTQSWSPLPSSLVSFLGTVTDVSHSTKNAGNYGWGIGFSGVTICAWFRCTLYDFGILGVRPNKHTLR